MQPETVSAFVFCFDPADEFASAGGFDWFWSKGSAQAAFDDACASSHYDADSLSVLQVLVPVSVIQQGWGATEQFIDLQVCLGPGRGGVGLLRERPAKTDAQPCTKARTKSCTKSCTKPKCKLTNQEPTVNRKLSQILHQQLVQIRDQARDWADGLPVAGFRAWAGICDNLNDCDPRLKYTLLRDLVEAWPAGTGDRIFPVPHPDRTPERGFTSSGAQEMWNPEYEYARNRWALLYWLIEQTKPNEESQS